MAADALPELELDELELEDSDFVLLDDEDEDVDAAADELSALAVLFSALPLVPFVLLERLSVR
ncbi:hypothetical protein [Actinosynnema sp. ALI-1.44]|uniref:hypothetical protein n=1 Tax=Actinosynnema sp. ALI-1.44 TaxID=1933779 RepID=UPI003F8D507A